MIINPRLSVLLLTLALLFVACKKNLAPDCTIIAPESPVNIMKGEAISISVAATDSDGSISEIKLLLNKQEIANSKSDQLVFQLNTNDLSLGQYSIKAIAYDNELLSGEDNVLMNVDASVPTLTTSEVSIINYLEVESGGFVSDDGGAPVVQCGICWSKEENPGMEDSLLVSPNTTGVFTLLIKSFEPGSTYYIRAFAENSSGIGYGNQVSFTVSDPNEEWEPGDIWVDYRDSINYKTVKIADQVWMAENLKAIRYNDGSEIPLITNNDTWSNLASPAYRWALDDEARFGGIYGPLYNCYTVETGKLCPAGWHVASDQEWFQLENYADPTIDDPDLSAWSNVRGTDGGTKLKAISGWGSTGNGTDDFGFSALPGGICYASGGFGSINGIGFWWSSSQSNEAETWYRSIVNYNGGITRRPLDKNAGLSVRCVKD